MNTDRRQKCCASVRRRAPIWPRGTPLPGATSCFAVLYCNRSLCVPGLFATYGGVVYIRSLTALLLVLAIPGTAIAVTVDAAKIPGGTYTVTVEKVLDSQHIVVSLGIDVDTTLTAASGRDFAGVKPNDRLRVSIINGEVPVFSEIAATTIAPQATPQRPVFDAAPTPQPSAFDAAATPRPPLPATTVLLPGGTTLEVSLAEPISSASANVGDVVPIVVDNEVDANGFIVIPKGSNGEGTVTLADRAGGNGHGGKLAITMNWVYSADHGKLLLSNVDHSAGAGSDQKGAASTATILTYVLLGPLGLFAHNFVHGKDVVVDTSRVFKVFIDHDVHVQATQKATAAPGFDQ